MSLPLTSLPPSPTTLPSTDLMEVATHMITVNNETDKKNRESNDAIFSAAVSSLKALIETLNATIERNLQLRTMLETEKADFEKWKAVSDGSLRAYKKTTARILKDADEAIAKSMDQIDLVEAAEKEYNKVAAAYNTHTHSYPQGNTNPPTIKMDEGSSATKAIAPS